MAGSVGLNAALATEFGYDVVRPNANARNIIVLIHPDDSNTEHWIQWDWDQPRPFTYDTRHPGGLATASGCSGSLNDLILRLAYRDGLLVRAER